MTTWHQQQAISRFAKANPGSSFFRHPTQWAVVYDSPGNPAGVSLHTEKAKAEQELALALQCGQACYMLPPSGKT